MSESTPSKKGRPTPKRKDAVAARKVSSLAPASTKEEKKRAKDAARAARIASRAAYLRGDENALPLRDKGPVKRYVSKLCRFSKIYRRILLAHYLCGAFPYSYSFCHLPNWQHCHYV